MLKRVLVAAVAAAFLAVAAGTAGAAYAPPASFTDPAGDAGTAPDVTGVGVTNDQSGLYTFTVSLASDYGDDAEFYLYLDSDKNPQTGDPENLGADYVVYDDHASHSAGLYKWTGSDWDDTSEDTMSFEISSSLRELTISVGKSELGGSTGFNFFAVSDNADGSDGHFDDVPSGTGALAYAFQKTLKLTLAGVQTVVMKAQHRLIVAAAAVRSDTGATVGADGAVTCHANGGARALPVSTKAFVSAGSGKGSAAVCQFVLPKKHVKLSATITISYGGATVTKTVSAKS
jgi:hypothetical protein